MFKNALAHVQHCYKAFFIYAGIVGGYVAIKVLAESYYLENKGAGDIESLSTLYLVASGLITTGVFSIGQALAFLRLGREIDKPFWKIESNFSTFIRFFSFWFTLNLITLTLQLLIIVPEIPADTKESLFICWLLFITTVIPFGATVMFYGIPGREEMAQACSTMIAQLPYYCAIFICTFFLYFYLIQIQASGLPDLALPLLEIIFVYIECVVFAFCWELCKKQRDELEHPDDFDF